MFGKILVTVDESPIAAKAAGVAIDLAIKYRAELWAISVAPVPEFGGTVGEVREVKNEGETRLGVRLREVKARGRALGIEVKTDLIYGHPAESILKYIKKNRFDLVVAGYKGSSAIDRFLLGSVSSKVVHHAPCSVILIKE
ncbi:MAG: universal stress protein [Syntrophomonadaceae bacterium]|nr:universal stress protein [Syntrophomonadaceae bacterium]